MKKRVVITGCGIISSIGNNCTETLKSLQENKSGIETIPEWRDLGFKSRVAGTIKGLEVDKMRQQIGMKSRYMDLSSLYTVLAATEAIEDSGLKVSDLNSDRVGCIVGSGISNTDPIFRAGYRLQAKGAKTTPYDITRCMCNSCSANLVNFYGIKGRSYSLSSACATSLHNIGHGMELISSGTCDMVLAGGAEEVTSILTFMFDSMRTVLSKSFNDCPEKASRPYDINRDGFVISGGGGIVVLEDYQQARQRNAPIYGEIIGYGANSDGYDIIQPHPQGDGAVSCINEALKVANCSPEEIDYVNTHATSTPTGDITESIALKRVFGNYKVPVSSTKSISGHGIGAAGVQELIYCLLMMKHGFISASQNIDELDPACNFLNIITENTNCSLNKILTISLGFGGTNACLIVERI